MITLVENRYIYTKSMLQHFEGRLQEERNLRFGNMEELKPPQHQCHAVILDQESSPPLILVASESSTKVIVYSIHQKKIQPVHIFNHADTVRLISKTEW